MVEEAEVMEVMEVMEKIIIHMCREVFIPQDIAGHHITMEEMVILMVK
jgi:hypothetical protein